MRYIVCVKQVPDTTEIKIDQKTNTLIRDGVPSILNPFDQFALEECLKTKKDDDEVIVVSMGPPQARSALMKCLALGADKAILVSDKHFAGADTLTTAYTLMKAINTVGNFDIIFCGLQAMDGDTAQVGPELAQHLGIQQLTYVESIECIENKKITVKQQSDEGYMITETQLPVLVACIPPTSFVPSDPKITSIMKAKKKPFTVLGLNELGGTENDYGLAASPTQVIKTYTPPAREKGIVITDEDEQNAVRKLVSMLTDKKVI